VSQTEDKSGGALTAARLPIAPAQGAAFGELARSRADTASMLAASVIVLALVLFRLGSKSVWQDEGFSIALARLNWSGMWRVISLSEPYMAFYYFLLHLWLPFGSSEAALRMLSALSAVATVPPFYAIGRRLLSRRCAAIATCLLVLNAFFIRYAQEARSYALVLFLVTLSSWLFVRALDDPKASRWSFYVVIAALAVYTHLFAVLVIVAHVLAAMVRPMPRRARGAPLGAGVVIGLLASPLVLFLLSRAPKVTWMQKRHWIDLPGAFLELTGYGGRILLALYFIVCAAALARFVFKRDNRSPATNWTLAFLLSWLFVPPAILFAISRLGHPVFGTRFLIISLPALLLLASVGVDSLRPPVLRAAVLGLMLLLEARGLQYWYQKFRNAEWRDAVEMVLAEAAPEDGLVFEKPYVRMPFEYYLWSRKAERRAPVPAFPTARWGSLDLIGADLVKRSADWVARDDRGFRRLWVIVSHEVIGGEGSTWHPEAFTSRYEVISARAFYGLRVFLFARRPAGEIRLPDGVQTPTPVGTHPPGIP
jgi:mannosyltransferase